MNDRQELKDILLVEIFIHPLRARKEFNGIEDLADSIKQYGLLEPLIVAPLPAIIKEKHTVKEYLLLSGHRRFLALQKAQEVSAPCVVRHDVDNEVLATEIECEENLNRENLTWIENLELRDRIHRLKKKQNNDWTLENTADLLDTSKGAISHDISLYNRLLEEDEEERKRLTSMSREAASRELQKRDKVKDAIKQIETNRKKVGVQFYNVNCLDGIKDIPNDSVDVVITDPPYANSVLEEAEGVGNKFTQNLVHTDNLNFEEMKDLFEKLLPELYRVLKPSSHLYMFFSAEYFGFFSEIFKRFGFEFQQYPIVWDKKRPTTRPTGYSYRNCYEMIFYAWKPPKKKFLNGDRRSIIECKPVSGTAKLHIFQKPEDLLIQLIEASSIIGDTVLDPFAGCGSVLSAADKLKRSAIGFEINKNHFDAYNILSLKEGML